MKLEELIKRKRELRLTCKEISLRSGVPMGTVQKIFAGTTTSPRYTTLQALEAVLLQQSPTCPSDLDPSMTASRIPDGTSPYHQALPGLPDGLLSEPSHTYGSPSHLTGDGSSAKEIPQQDRKDCSANPGVQEMQSNPSEDHALRDRTYSIKDMESLPDGVRAELIDGVLYLMGVPKTIHQRLVTRLCQNILNHMDEIDSGCDVLSAPFGVDLQGDESTLLQPDISVICDPDILGDDGCHGAPDWVIEVISPSSRRRDTGIKFVKYFRAGVRLYWIIDPEIDSVLVHDFIDGSTAGLYRFSDAIPVAVCAGFSICIDSLLKRSATAQDPADL